MEVYSSEYVLYGAVAPELNLQERFQLFRKEMIAIDTGQPIPNCEVWRLGSTSGPIVVAINAQLTRFRGEGGVLYVLTERG